MTATTPSPEPDWLALGAGQTGLHWLAAGTTLVALEGRLQLEPPSRWMVGMQHTLSAGHAHVLETSGWWHLRADARSGAHLRVVMPAGNVQRAPWPAIWRWLGSWAQPRQTSRG